MGGGFKEKIVFKCIKLNYIALPFFVLLHSMSMKVPTIVQEAQQALQDGYCVVIGLQSTGEVGLACLPCLG